jgi:chitodextrinase
VGTTAANEVSFIDQTTVGRTSYYYKVRAANLTSGTDSSPQLVTTPNGLPSLTSFETITGTAGQSFQRTINATDPDGDAIVFTTLNLPSFATLVDNGNGTGYIQFNPAATQAGTYAFTLQASDNFSGRSELKTYVIATDPAYGETVLINFKGAAGTGDAAAPWNNLEAFTNGTTLKNVQGATSAITLTTGANWTGSSNTAGVVSESGLYPSNVLASHWSTTSTTGATLVLKGLDNAKRYNLTLSGSLNQFWFANTVYVVNGTQKILNTSKNTSKYAKFAGIQPAGDSIVITVRKGANVNSNPVVAQRDGILGSLVIEAATPGVNPIRPASLTAEGLSKSAIKLTWVDNSSDETGFEIYRATSQAGPFNLIQTTAPSIETFTNTGLAQNTAYVYKIRAVKPGGASAYADNAYASTFNQIVLVNVNSSAGSGQLQAAAPWNNLASPPSAGLSFTGLKDDTNANTSVGLDLLVWGSGGTNNTGYLTGNNTGIYPDAVLENYYYFEQFDSATTYRLSGLNNNQEYDLVFLGNEWNVATTGNMIVATDYTVNGTTVSQFNGKNSTETVAVKNVAPDASTIAFDIKANDEARYGVWNSLELRSHAPMSATFDLIAPTAPQALVASNITGSSALLTWSASTDNVGVTGYNVYRQGYGLVTTVAGTSANVTGLTVSTSYLFYVKALDAAQNESASSLGARVTTGANGRIAVSETATVAEEVIFDADIFPNPAKASLKVKLSSAVRTDAPVAIAIYNLQGVAVQLQQRTNQAEGIDIGLEDYNIGLYILKIEVDGKQLIKRFVKE